MNIANELLHLNFKQLYFKDQRYDKQILNEAINHLAAYLQKNIYSNSPFVLFTAYNHIKTIISYYAILKAGKIAVILDPECKSIELTETIEDINPAAIIFINNITIRFNYDEEIIFRKPDKHFIIDSDLSDVCTIAYTNAENGYSKGAMLTEKNLLADMQAFNFATRTTLHSVVCALLPYAHSFGFMQGVLVPTHCGVSSLIMELNLFQLENILDQIKSIRVTHLYAVPAVYYILSKCNDIKDYLTHVEMFFTGGTTLPEFIYEKFLNKTGKKLRVGYGLTECAPGVVIDHLYDEPILNSCGQAIPGAEFIIINENGEKCKSYSVGEICIRGDMLFKGFFNNDFTNQQLFDSGWYRSGDLGSIDNKGNLYFKGVKKNMINVSGINVYPKKLERLMKKNENVLEITIDKQESVLQGEIVNAKVKLRDNSTNKQNEFKNWCRNYITNSILPKTWEFK